MNYQELEGFIDARIAYNQAVQELAKLRVFLIQGPEKNEPIDPKILQKEIELKEIMRSYEERYAATEKTNLIKLSKLMTDVSKKEKLPVWMTQGVLLKICKVESTSFGMITASKKFMQCLVGSNPAEKKALDKYIAEVKPYAQQDYNYSKALANIHAYKTEHEFSNLLFAMTKLASTLKRVEQKKPNKNTPNKLLIQAIADTEFEWSRLVHAREKMQAAFMEKALHPLVSQYTNQPDHNLAGAANIAENDYIEVREKYIEALNNLKNLSSSLEKPSHSRLRAFTSIFTRSDTHRVAEYAKNVNAFAQTCLKDIENEKGLEIKNPTPNL